jgi:hypothetical protein
MTTPRNAFWRTYINIFCGQTSLKLHARAASGDFSASDVNPAALGAHQVRFARVYMAAYELIHTRAAFASELLGYLECFCQSL